MLANEARRLQLEYPIEFTAMRRAQMLPLEEVLEQGLASGDFPNAQPHLDARSIHAVTWALAEQRLAGDDSLDLIRARAGVAVLFPALGFRFGVTQSRVMRVYISVDMEGVSGVTRWQDVSAAGQDYQRARSWMTADVNAAVEGARAAGATSFVVEENHGVEMLCNLVLDEIDPEVEVVRGQPRGGATTAAALDDSFDALMLVGHHAKVGDYPGVCAHTISYGEYRDVRCNGRTISEGEIFATIAAQCGVPTVLIAGDDVVCAEMQKVCPGIETACVKRALSRTAAAIIPPVRAQRVIATGARHALERLRAGEITAPEFAPPFAFEIDLRQPLSDDARVVIGERFRDFTVVGDHTLAFSHADMGVAYRMAAISSYLARQPHDVRSY